MPHYKPEDPNHIFIYLYMFAQGGLTSANVHEPLPPSQLSKPHRAKFTKPDVVESALQVLWRSVAQGLHHSETGFYTPPPLEG